MNLDTLTKHFPAGEIKQREGRGGMTLDYLETHTVIERLNEAFDGEWSFRVMDAERTVHEVIVRGRLEAGVQTKEQYGSSEISNYKSGDRQGEPMSLGDEYKAAASDCLKKCATEFGVGLELYDEDERNKRRAEQGQPAEKPRATEGSKGATEKQIKFIQSLSDKAHQTGQIDAEYVKDLWAEIGKGIAPARASEIIERLKDLPQTEKATQKPAGEDDPYKRFLDDCVRAKKKLFGLTSSDDKYYQTLSSLGYEKSNQVPKDAEKMNSVIKALAQAVKDSGPLPF